MIMFYVCLYLEGVGGRDKPVKSQPAKHTALLSTSQLAVTSASTFIKGKRTLYFGRIYPHNEMMLANM